MASVNLTMVDLIIMKWNTYLLYEKNKQMARLGLAKVLSYTIPKINYYYYSYNSSQKEKIDFERSKHSFT